MRNRILAGGLIVMSGLLFSACSKDDAKGNIMVRMTDAPGDYQQVNVDIVQVSVHMSKGGWTDLPTKAGVYNLLTLQNGIDTTIVNTTSLPAGDITQMRLLLGSNNTVMVDSIVYPMDVPSGSQSGVKLTGDITVPGGSDINVLLDFDAKESVVKGGNDEYHLKPSIKVVP
jgi:hypothetical protein